MDWERKYNELTERAKALMLDFGMIVTFQPASDVKDLEFTTRKLSKLVTKMTLMGESK